MATWAVDAFGNDYAQDWAEDLHQTTSMEALESTLDNLLSCAGGDEGAYIDAPFAAEALVAIEVLARLQGKGGPCTDDSAAIDAWVDARKHKPVRARPDLAEKALRAIALILSDQSELRALWADSEHHAQWLACVEELKSRLQP